MRIFLFFSIILLYCHKITAQTSLSESLAFNDGTLEINASAKSGEDSFFQLSNSSSNKTVFWEVFRETGTLKRKYELNRLPQGYYKFQFALDGKAVYGEVSNLSSGVNIKIYDKDTFYKRPYFNVTVEGDTLNVDGYFGKHAEVTLSIKNETEEEDAFNSKVSLKDGALKTQYILSDFQNGLYVIRASMTDKTFVRNFNLK
ncbi:MULTISPECIES: hypothetical protein [Flammeovirga]|uniref:Uncharacterized protein n=1 Tax=Flammeovirga agarivorans TaxID=2726742 RepID=A0A7X8XXP1_9BACT|nr:MULTISPECIES: hypothetical protein [Flammeovirga]NLR93275.1 hypothetical protein [Flammeovirga agarivorans]